MTQGILIIEDEPVLAKNIKRYLERQGCEVRIAADGPSGLKVFESFKPDLVLLDVNLPGLDGLEVLRRLRSQDRTVKVVLMTAYGTVQVAVQAMKDGAYDYLTKPVVLGELALLVDKAIGQQRLEGALSYYRAREAGESGLDKILGDSPPMIAVRQRITQLLAAEERLTEGVAPPVLITGETGTGKELIARALHYDGARRDAPFVELNCATLPSHLVESELFGYERGAFTDARERKTGLIESADRGTLFLDEVGELDLAVQVKLLKLLEDGMVRRLGSVRDRQVNVRVISATNRALEDMVREGQFRSDLYFRLKVVVVELPPLRGRGSDILLLAEHYLAQHARRYGRSGIQLSCRARDAIQRYQWYGNVRELRNALEQAVLLAVGTTIEPEDIPFSKVTEVEEAANGGTLSGVERSLIERALADSGGNVTLAAKVLGISRDTLRYRIEKHGLRPRP